MKKLFLIFIVVFNVFSLKLLLTHSEKKEFKKNRRLTSLAYWNKANTDLIHRKLKT